MSEQPSGNLGNSGMTGRFKQYSRPVQYSQRPKSQLFSDVTDQFSQVYQEGLNQTVAQPIQPVSTPQVQQQVQYQQPVPLSVQQIQPQQPVQQSTVNNQVPRSTQVDQFSQPQPAPQPVRQPQPAQQQPAVTAAAVGMSLLPKQPQQQYVQPQVTYQQPVPQQAPVVQQLQPQQQVQYQQPAPQAVQQVETQQAAQQPQPAQLQQPVPIQAPIYTNNYGGEYEDEKPKKFSFKRSGGIKKKTLLFSSGLAVTVLLAGAFVVFMNWNNGKNVAQAQASVQGNSDNQGGGQSAANLASAVEPTKSQIDDYSTDPTAPRYLIVPKLNIKSMIKPITLNSTNHIKAPDNIYNVGWWQSSSAPGQNGATVLDGFTNNSIASGVFATLNKLAPNDTFQIEVGNGTKYNYKVVKSVVFATNGVNIDQAITPVTPGKPNVNIITCSGLTQTCPTTGNGDFILFAVQT